MYSDKKNLLDWIENKIKTRDYLNSSNPADVRNQLVSATKIIHDFESPKLSEENGIRFRTTYHGSASDFAKFDHTFMGSRVDARMAEISQHFDGVDLSEIQRAIVDVSGGKGNNLMKSGVLV